MSVRLSHRMEQLGPNWMDSHKIWYSSILEKKIRQENSSFITVRQE